MAAEAVAGFGKAVELAGADGPAEEATRTIDGGFNLAQALMAGRGLMDEGAGGSVGEALRMADEARAWLERVEALQRQEMANAGFTAADDGAQPAEDDVDIPALTSAAAAAEAEARTTTLITPNQVLDTLLELIQALLALHSSAPPDGSAPLSLALVAALDRAVGVRQLIPAGQDNREQDIEFELAALAVADALATAGATGADSKYALPPAQVRDRYALLVTSSPGNPELASAYADHLVDSVPTSPSAAAPSSETLATIELALATYQKAHALLSDRFAPVKSIPAHTLPSLLVSNLLSRAHVLLLLHHLEPSTALPDGQLPLAAAHRLALDAVPLSGVGVKFSANGGLVRLGPAEPRQDWRSAKAFRDAAVAVARVRMRDSSGKLGAAGEVLGVWAKLSGRELRAEVEWAVGEVRGDGVWEASGGEEEGAWARLLASA